MAFGAGAGRVPTKGGGSRPIGQSSGGSSSGGGGSSSRKAEFITDQYGNIRQIGGEPTKTAEQILEQVTLTSPGGKKTVVGTGYQKGIQEQAKNIYKRQSQPTVKRIEGKDLRQSSMYQDVRTLQQPGEFVQMAELPYGTAQRTTISELKKEQKLAKKEAEAAKKTNYEVLQESPFLSVKGQAARFKNVGKVYSEIIENARKGQFFKGATVAPEYRKPGFKGAIGDVAGFISSPANILIQPAMVAGSGLALTGKGALYTGARVLRGGVQGFYGATTGVILSRRGIEQGELSTRYSKEQRDFLVSQEAERKIALGFRASEDKIRQEAQFNKELEFFTNERERLEDQYRQAGIEQGLQGGELDKFVDKGVDDVYKPAIRDYYKNQGYSPEKAAELQKIVLKGQNKDQTWYSKSRDIPFTKYSINPKAIASEISLFFQDKKEYEKAIRESYKGSGLSSSEVDKRVNALLKYRSTEGRAEALSYLAAEVFGGEFTGQGLFRNLLASKAKTGARIAAKGAGTKIGFLSGLQATAPAGAIEASVGTIAQQDIRRRERNVGEIVRNSLIGAGTAGVLGGFTIGTRVAQKTGRSKVIQGIGYIVDPFELPGDITANYLKKAGQRVQRSFGRSITPAPGIFTPKGPEITFGFTPSQSTTQTQSQTKGRKRIKSIVPSQQVSTNLSQIQSNIASNINIPGQAQVTTPTETQAFSFTFTGTPAQTPSQAPSQTPTQTSTNVPINIPVITPIFRAPPPFLPPLLGGFGESGKGIKGRKRKRYVNELAVGLSLIGASASGRLNQQINKALKPKTAKKTTRRKSKKKKR